MVKGARILRTRFERQKLLPGLTRRAEKEAQVTSMVESFPSCPTIGEVSKG